MMINSNAAQVVKKKLHTCYTPYIYIPIYEIVKKNFVRYMYYFYTPVSNNKSIKYLKQLELSILNTKLKSENEKLNSAVFRDDLSKTVVPKRYNNIGHDSQYRLLFFSPQES